MDASIVETRKIVFFFLFAEINDSTIPLSASLIFLSRHCYVSIIKSLNNVFSLLALQSKVNELCLLR